MLRLFNIIAMDPSIDGMHKIVFALPPIILSVYVADQRFWIYYRISNTTVEIVNVKRRDPIPPPW